MWSATRALSGDPRNTARGKDMKQQLVEYASRALTIGMSIAFQRGC